MAQSLAQIHVHIVFSTKDRAPFLKDPSIAGDLHGFMAGVCRKLDSQSVIIGGTDDHVHVFCVLSKSRTITEVVRDIKRASSGWIKERDRGLSDFRWQAGYGAFSVSPGHVAPLKRYIQDQKRHHEKETFQDEFRKILKKCGVDWDERYVWD